MSWALECSAAVPRLPCLESRAPLAEGKLCRSVSLPSGETTSSAGALQRCCFLSEALGPAAWRWRCGVLPGRQMRLPPGGPRIRRVCSSAMDGLPPCLPLDGAPAARHRGRWLRGGGGPRPSVGTCVVCPRGARSGSTAAAVSRAPWEHRAWTRLLSGCVRTQEPWQELFSRETVEAVTRVCDFPVSSAHVTQNEGIR